MDVDEFIRKNGKTVNEVDAGFFRRLASFIFDILLLNIISFSSISLAIETDFVSVDKTIQIISGPEGAKLMLVIAFASIVALAYFSLMEYAASATIGMMFFGLKVKGDLPFWKCVARNIFIIPFFPFTLLWVVDPIYLVFKKKRLLEKITGTQTIVINDG